MKKYIVPTLTCVNLRAEESIASVISGCTGCCTQQEADDHYKLTGVRLIALGTGS